MKAILLIMLLASLVVNAALLAGCISVSAKSLNAPAAFKGDELRSNRSAIDDGSKDLFDRQQSFIQSLEGKTVIAIEPEKLEKRPFLWVFMIQPKVSVQQ